MFIMKSQSVTDGAMHMHTQTVRSSWPRKWTCSLYSSGISSKEPFFSNDLFLYNHGIVVFTVKHHAHTTITQDVVKVIFKQKLSVWRLKISVLGTR